MVQNGAGLTVHKLSKQYSNGVKALNEVSLEIGPGLFGLLGRNGAGKSTLMRTLATLQLPDSGSAHLGQFNILKEPEAVRQRLGYLLQLFGVYPRVSASNLLDHLARLRGWHERRARQARVHELLERVNLLSVGNRNLDSFSGGMKQRFGIAQALLGDPELLIVDEPTAGLDPEERNRFYDVLSETAQEKVVILSTHLVEDVSSLCLQMAILERGTIVVSGSVDVFMNSYEGRLWSRRQIRGMESTPTRGSLVSTRAVRGEREQLVLADSCPGDGFSAVSVTLEAAYFASLKEGQEFAGGVG